MALTPGDFAYLGGDKNQPVVVVAVTDEGIRYSRFGPLDALPLVPEGEVWSASDTEQNTQADANA